jgi:hypothetical protein
VSHFYPWKYEEHVDEDVTHCSAIVGSTGPQRWRSLERAVDECGRACTHTYLDAHTRTSWLTMTSTHEVGGGGHYLQYVMFVFLTCMIFYQGYFLWCVLFACVCMRTILYSGYFPQKSFVRMGCSNVHHLPGRLFPGGGDGLAWGEAAAGAGVRPGPGLVR